MLTGRDWTERLVLAHARHSRRAWGAQIFLCFVMIFAQLSAYLGSHEAWRLWTSGLFALLAFWSSEVRVLSTVLERTEKRLYELESSPDAG